MYRILLIYAILLVSGYCWQSTPEVSSDQYITHHSAVVYQTWSQQDVVLIISIVFIKSYPGKCSLSVAKPMRTIL